MRRGGGDIIREGVSIKTPITWDMTTHEAGGSSTKIGLNKLILFHSSESGHFKQTDFISLQ